MSRSETSSNTGQGEPPPPKEERDGAFSSGGGRKAEVTLSDRTKPKVLHDKTECNSAPIGLEMETRAGLELHEGSQIEPSALARKDSDAADKRTSHSQCTGSIGHVSGHVARKVIHRGSAPEAVEKLRHYAEELDCREKPLSARKVRAVAAKITLQEQNEIDGFPKPELL